MTLDDRLDSVGYYDRDADRFAARYDAVAFDAVHPMLSRHLPLAGRALDVGAGSGRDARALVARGLQVTAVEPAAEFRRIGVHTDPSVRWTDDRLPALAGLEHQAGTFDFILCSAVLMLVTPTELAKSFAAMARLLSPTGRLGINLRAAIPSEPVDLFHTHGDTAIIGAARAAGLVCLERDKARDALGRASHVWHAFLFAPAAAASARPV